ncbi:MAG: type IX secretion system membrane protein PorP/SprF [Saprospiraceae bacterium]|nr:type IX secretion system membrane protein PorP/SprF [Saprospiraceae bacterium]
MKQSITVFCLLFFGIGWVSAQQPAQYTLYMFNQMNYNPGYAGFDNSISLTGVYRKQWAGLEGSPTTQALNVNLPINYTSGGFGLMLENDILGAEQHTSVMAAYNYQLYLENGILSMGIAGGIVQKSLDGQAIRTPDGIYTEPGSIDHQDPILPLNKESTSVSTFSAGVYYESEAFEAGFAVHNLTEPEADFSTINLSTVRHYILNVGTSFEIGRNVLLMPSALVRSDVTQTQAEVSLLARFNERFLAGTSFRGYNANSIDAVSIIAGFKLGENISMAYAYDVTLSGISAVSNGTHEIMVNYNLNKPIGKGKPPKIIYNPRSL